MPGWCCCGRWRIRLDLTGGLSRVLATRRLLVHDRGRVLADLAAAIGDGAEAISDFAGAGRPARRCPARSPRCRRRSGC